MNLLSEKTHPAISFHGGHSAQFCDHAPAGFTAADNVRAYLENGFSHFAITEHCPPHSDSFLYPEELQFGHNARFLKERFKRYFNEYRDSLYQLVAGKAHILVGFESEFYGTEPVERTLDLVRQYNPDVVVLSVHHVDDIPIDYDERRFQEALYRSGSLDKLYLRYFDHQLELIYGIANAQLNCAVILGHFDLVKIFAKVAANNNSIPRLTDLSNDVRAAMIRNIECAVRAGFVFDVNARSFKKGLKEPYPSEEILKLISDRKGEITLGDDAHAPNEVGLNLDLSIKSVKKYFNSLVAYQRGPEGRLQKIKISI